MRFPLFELDPTAFERLAVAICCKLLGPGTQPFSEGPDGGRDARFEGTAQLFPSSAQPLAGRMIIQAKHTTRPGAKISDAEFSGPSATSTISAEKTRICRLVQSRELDHYFLFTNRRVSGNADAALRDDILTATGVSSVHVFGEERIGMLLKTYPDLVQDFSLADLAGPPMIDPSDLAEVICAFVGQGGAIRAGVAPVDQLERVRFSTKNTANGLSEEFAKYIRQRYLPDFTAVKSFLAHPDNRELQERYDAAAAEIHEQLIVNRGAIPFDEFLVKTQRILFERDGDLARHKRLTRLVLFYMYWNCDFGLDGAP